jgi:hypothetical protein
LQHGLGAAPEDRLRKRPKKAWTTTTEHLIGRDQMREWALLLAVIGIWVLLQAYILPKLGIST